MQATRAFLRKARAGDRFDREKASEPTQRDLSNYVYQTVDDLLDFITLDRAKQLQTELWMAGSFERNKARKTVMKTARNWVDEVLLYDAPLFYARKLEVTQQEKDILESLLAEWTAFDDHVDVAEAVNRVNAMATFDAAANFLYSKLGFPEIDFNLRNPQIIERLEQRSTHYIDFFVRNIEDTKETILAHFIENGQGPVNQEFMDALKETIGPGRPVRDRAGNIVGWTRGNPVTDYAAKRFAWTECGVIQMDATQEVVQRSMIPIKEWSGVPGKDSRHFDKLDGAVRKKNDTFYVNGHTAWGPYDTLRLPIREYIQCKCDLFFDVPENWEPDWTGE